MGLLDQRLVALWRLTVAAWGAGVAGMHIMPVTPRGWRQLSVFMAEGRI